MKMRGGSSACLRFWDGAEPSAFKRGSGEYRRRGLSREKADDGLRRDMDVK